MNKELKVPKQEDIDALPVVSQDWTLFNRAGERTTVVDARGNKWHVGWVNGTRVKRPWR